MPGEAADDRAGRELHDGAIPHELVRQELDRILHSEDFRASKRSQEFLTYVVDHALKGTADGLKERTIGIDVFHRLPSYDPGEDATVRVKAGEVRKRLGLYYARSGAGNPIRIELPSGSYTPSFRTVKAAITLAAAPAPALEAARAAVAETPLSGARTITVYTWLAIPAAVVALLVAVYLIAPSRPDTTPLGQFWAPVLKGKAPVSLCVAHVPVYGLDREPTPAAPARGEEFVQLKDQFVGAGDLVASVRISSMLSRQERPYVLKMGSDVSFHDLRTAPAILIGYSYTRWKEISSQMRFVIDTSHNPVGIVDNGKPTDWTLPGLPRDRKTDLDYAIVSRVFHPDTNAMLVELAGITSYGTDAAADLVTNSDLLAAALAGAPSGWQRKNLQLVISVKIIGGTPATPKVIAAHFW